MKNIIINEEIKKAIEKGLPVVALESTIISHGMPYPKNVETALEAENVIRNEGAIPATIAIIKGKLKVGLTPSEIEYLGKEGLKVTKTSRRDIPYIVARGLNGATTVSATMYIASLAKIKIFATGGVGGVHRQAEETFDVSCDLEELGRTSVAVVCAGVKSILDIPKTLEYLETKGVLTIGYKTKVFPAFYTSQSKSFTDIKCDSSQEISKILKTKWDLGLEGGVLIANPIPKQFEMDPKIIDKAISDALHEMNKLNITGKKCTPYLLSKICDITKGDSLESNIKLVYNNCKLAAQIAKDLYK